MSPEWRDSDSLGPRVDVVDPLEDPVTWYRAKSSKPSASPEERIAQLERTVAGLRRDVASLQTLRRLDEPAIQYAEWERRWRRIGIVVGVIVFLVTTIFVIGGAATR